MDFSSFFKEPLKTIRRSRLLNFGTKREPGDMSVFDRRGAIHVHRGEKSIAEAGNGYTPNDPIAIYRPGGSKNIDDAKAMASNFGWVYSCVKAIADEMAGIEFRAYTTNKDGEREEVTDHDLINLLNGVNETQTGEEFKKVMASHLELTGSAYIYMMGVKNFDDQPDALYLLNPGNVKMILDKTTYPYKVVKYEMTDDSRKFTFQPHEIIHVKYPDPSNPFLGLGTVQGIAEWIDNDNSAMNYNRNFFKNGARLSGIFETDMTSTEQTSRLKTSFDEQFTGEKNAYKVMVAPKGVKFVSTQASAKDMDFANLLDTTAQRILAGFRVSKTILGTAESDTNRSTAETADYVFAKRTIKPKMDIIVAALNNFLAPRFDDSIYISFDDPIPEDKAFRIDEMNKAVAGKQVITQNEARQEFMGLGPVDDPAADLLATGMSSTNAVISLGHAAPRKKEAKVLKVAKKTKAIVTKKKLKTQFSRNKDTRKKMAADLATKIKEVLETAQKKSIAEMTDDEYIAVYYTHQKSRMDEFEPNVTAALKSIDDKQRREVIKNLDKSIKTYRLTSKKDILPKELFDMDEYVQLTIDGLTPIISDFFTKEAEAALRNIGAKPFDILSNELVKRALDKRIELLSRSYNETTLDALKTELQKGLDEGLGLTELTDRVMGIYEWNSSVRAGMVSKTEVVAVSNMANKDAWKEAGSVKTVKWYTSEKDNVCDFCRAMNGKTIDIDINFFNKGETLTVTDASGEKQSMDMDYSAIGGPPLHPNCGCFIRPASYTPITI